MALSSSVNLLPYPLLNLMSILKPEKEKSFDYLSKYFPCAPLESLSTNYNLNEIIKKEKIIHDMITNATNYKTTRTKAWMDYLSFIHRLFGKNDLRYFLCLENFTKSSSNDKENFTNNEFTILWMTYVEMCEDSLEVVKYMKKYNICTKMSFFYYATAIIYEKYHDFVGANQVFLEGLENERNLVDAEEFHKHYKNFEGRMESRISREVGQSIFSSEEIHEYIQNQLKIKSAVPSHHEGFGVGEKRSKNSENLNYQAKKKKFEYYPGGSSYQNPNLTYKDNINSINYGEVPIFIDEPFRKTVITKGSKLVETYSILFKFLVENDHKFKIQNEDFINKLAYDRSRMPSSWMDGNRILPDKILTNYNENLTNLNLPKKENVKEEKKTIDDVVNNMAREINKKKEEPQLILPDNKHNPIENSKTVSDFAIKTQPEIIEPQSKSVLGQTETTDNEGRKYRIVKVETSKKETVMSLNLNKMIDEETKVFQPLSKIRAIAYLKLKEKERKEKEEKEAREAREAKDKLKKRKTIIYKVDSDGDMCMSSDEEEEQEKQSETQIIPQPNKTEINTQKNIINNFNTRAEVINNVSQNFKSSSIVEPVAQVKEYKKDNQFVIKEEKVTKIENILNRQNLNLFEKPKTFEEISEKMQETEKMFQLGLINIETRDLICDELEEKIIQLEIIEKEKEKTVLNKGSKIDSSLFPNQNIQSFNQINNRLPQPKNESMSKNNPYTNSYSANLNNLNTVNLFLKPQTQQNELIHYLENKSPSGNVNININKNKQTNNIQILKEQITNPANAFQNVSRSLDFTNLNIIENTKTKPMSSLFENSFKKGNLFHNDMRTLPCDEFSISFDSEHSHMFQQPRSNSAIKEEDYILDITPNKRDSFQLSKAFNIKDTPQLLKKAQVQFTEPIQDNNHIRNQNNFGNVNTNNINNVNSFLPQQGQNAQHKNKFTDLNNIFESDDENEKEKKKGLSKLFGDAFGMGNQVYGLSSITEKTIENTYLSDDSFLFKK